MPTWTRFADGSGSQCRVSGLQVIVCVDRCGDPFTLLTHLPRMNESVRLQADTLESAQAEALRLVRERCQEIIQATEDV